MVIAQSIVRTISSLHLFEEKVAELTALLNGAVPPNVGVTGWMREIVRLSGEVHEIGKEVYGEE